MARDGGCGDHRRCALDSALRPDWEMIMCGVPSVPAVFSRISEMRRCGTPRIPKAWMIHVSSRDWRSVASVSFRGRCHTLHHRISLMHEDPPCGTAVGRSGIALLGRGTSMEVVTSGVPRPCPSQECLLSQVHAFLLFLFPPTFVC